MFARAVETLIQSQYSETLFTLFGLGAPIAPEDRRMLKFLWFHDIDKEIPEIKYYQFRRLPFGLTPSPAVLASNIRYHLSHYQETHPNIASLLLYSLFVDDFAGGAYEDS